MLEVSMRGIEEKDIENMHLKCAVRRFVSCNMSTNEIFNSESKRVR